MRHIPVIGFLFMCLIHSKAQDGLSLEGNLGLQYTGSAPAYSLQLEGRYWFSPQWSASAGVGLWDSGIRGEWMEQVNSNTQRFYHVSDHEVMPSLQAGLRYERSLFSLNNRDVAFFLQGKTYLLMRKQRNTSLYQKEYSRDDAQSPYMPSSATSGSVQGHAPPSLHAGLDLGLNYPLNEEYSIAVSYGFSNIDLFTAMRNKSLLNVDLNPWIPNPNLQSFGIGIRRYFGR